MSNKIWIRKNNKISKMALSDWKNNLKQIAPETEAELMFMSGDHHMIRNFVVQELPRTGKPISTKFISERLKLPIELVKNILDDLEKNLTFLFRNKQGSVIWAYPVTVDKTSHHVTFSTGEKLYAT